MDTSLTDSRCPKCGAPLPKDAPLGACPACLLAVAGQPASQLTDGLTADLTDAISSGAYRNEPARFSPGDTCGSYRIVSLLGRGGMGEVYEAVGDDGRRVALKLLREKLTDRIDRERFLREGVLAASVTHPNCVYVYGSEEIGDVPVIAMELATQGTLKHAVEQFGPRTPTEAVREILQVIAGLEAAAAAGILHRDVKPSNCFIAADGGIKVGDFGLSISLNPSDGEIMWKPAFQGTPEYAAPEQLRGEALDLRADIYGVGATLFFLLTGYSPFGERNIKKLIELKTARSAPDPGFHLPGIPSALAALAGRCMSPDPDRRPQTYADLRARLLPFASDAPVPASMARRFGAIFIDSWASGVLVPLTTAMQLMSLRKVDRVIVAVFSLAAYSIFEGLLGGTPGKLVLGIRVTNLSGQRPSLAQAAARWAIGIGFPVTVGALQQAGLIPMHGAVMQTLIPASGALLLCSAIFARLRPDNAMFHDLWTGTRVVRAHPHAVAETVEQPTVDMTGAVATMPVDLDRVGPFEVVGRIGDTSGGDLLLGRDARLRRFVWIHRRPGMPGALSAARRQLSQPTRLRWLAGEETWDAFEVPDGRAFLAAGAARSRWQQISVWLADLARDLEAAEAIAALPVLSLDRLWLSGDGRVVLLDFRAPGTAGGDDEAAKSAPEFLAKIATAAASDRDQPRSVRLVTNALNESWMTTRAAAAILQKLAHQTVELSRWRRVLPILACTLPAIVYAAGSWLDESVTRARYAQPDAALRLETVASWLLQFLVPCAVLSFATSFIAVPFLFRLSGQSLDDAEGIDADVARRVARSFLTWCPLLLLPFNSWLPLVLLAGGAGYAIISPERSIQDRLAGTFVAPR